MHIAAFWDALYRLTWSDNWERDGSDTAADVARVWDEIYESIRDRLNEGLACGDECPGFYLQINDVNCPNEEELRTTRVIFDNGTCSSRERVHFSRSILDLTAGVARIGYSCFDATDDTACGGHIAQVRAFKTGLTGSPSWVLQWRDCVDADHEVIVNGIDEFVHNDFEAQWLCLSLNDNFCATVAIDGPVLCAIT